MAREATGELRPLADGWAARITIEGRTRRDFVLAACATDAEAVERCKALASMAARLRHAKQAQDLEKLLEMGAKARAGRPWETVCVAVDALCRDGGTREKNAAKVPTVAELAGDWTSGRLHTRFPDHVGKKKPRSVDRDEGIARNYVRKHIGDHRLTDVTLDDCELVNVPADREAASRRQVAQFMGTLLKYAAYPCRHISASPIPRGWLPKIPKPKAMQHLRPDEDVKHLANKGLPLYRRLFLGISRREGFRKEELAALRFRDLDLELGAVRLDENKTDSPRAWALSPDVAEALRRWRDCCRTGAKADDYVFVAENGYTLDVSRLAEEQRADLLASGVTRPELHHDGPNRMKLRAHDARASFITCALANDRTEAWVMDRTGHTTSAMLNRYRRLARTWGELGLVTWAPLHEVLPELAGTVTVPAAIAPRIAHKSPGPLAESADAADLKSAAREGVRVQVPKGPPCEAGGEARRDRKRSPISRRPACTRPGHQLQRAISLSSVPPRHGPSVGLVVASRARATAIATPSSRRYAPVSASSAWETASCACPAGMAGSRSALGGGRSVSCAGVDGGAVSSLPFFFVSSVIVGSGWPPRPFPCEENRALPLCGSHQSRRPRTPPGCFIDAAKG
jgi:integrase